MQFTEPPHVVKGRDTDLRVGMIRIHAYPSSPETGLVMPVQRCRVWCVIGFIRRSYDPAMQSIVIPAVFELLFNPLAYLEMVIVRHGHVSGIE